MGITKLTRFMARGDGNELEVEFTLTRVATSYARLIEEPRATDIPEDMRAGLRAWLDDGPAKLDPARVRAALEAVIEHQDYDLHKAILSDEETGEDTYPAVVEQFMRAYSEAGQ